MRQYDGLVVIRKGCGDDWGLLSWILYIWVLKRSPIYFRLWKEVCAIQSLWKPIHEGHQTFRTVLPMQAASWFLHAADGQLGIMKTHREWRIGDHEWLSRISNDQRKVWTLYWHTGSPTCRVIEEPHHNTYDIEFWGPGWHAPEVLSWRIEMQWSDGPCFEKMFPCMKVCLKRKEIYGTTYMMANISFKTFNTKDSKP